MDPIQQAQQQNQQPQPTQEDMLAATNQALLKKKAKEVLDQQDLYTPAQISQAMAQTKPASTQGQIGKAIQTPNYAGYCLKWVDDQQGNDNRFPTAIADYSARLKMGNVKTGDAPKGARVYFSPNESNGNLGHVGISLGNGEFSSATDNGVKTFSIKDWVKSTGQSLLGWSK